MYFILFYLFLSNYLILYSSYYSFIKFHLLEEFVVNDPSAYFYTYIDTHRTGRHNVVFHINITWLLIQPRCKVIIEHIKGLGSRIRLTSITYGRWSLTPCYKLTSDMEETHSSQDQLLKVRAKCRQVGIENRILHLKKFYKDKRAEYQHTNLNFWFVHKLHMIKKSE